MSHLFLQNLLLDFYNQVYDNLNYLLKYILKIYFQKIKN